MTKYLADTNIFVAVFKGQSQIKSYLEKVSPAINTIVYLELIQGAKNKVEVKKIEEYLARFELIHFDAAVSVRAIELVRQYSKSHGLMLPDAVISATCLENSFILITFNSKEFTFIEGLKLTRPPL